jgi:hypothetical protein
MHAIYQPLFTQIEQHFEALYQQLGLLNEAVLHQPLEENKWSCLQHMVHVNLSFEGTINYINKKMLQPELIPNAGITHTIKSKLLNRALNSDSKFKAPNGLDTMDVITTLQSTKATTQAQLQRLKELLELYPDSMKKKAVFRHPIAGQITLKQTLSFLDAHLMHHGRQIVKFIEKQA